MLDRALGRLFAECREDDACSDAFPGLEDAFESLKTATAMMARSWW